MVCGERAYQNHFWHEALWFSDRMSFTISARNSGWAPFSSNFTQMSNASAVSPVFRSFEMSCMFWRDCGFCRRLG